jgi:N-methylhydantoinase A
MTDACLLLGILDGERFAGGQMRLDRDAAQRAFDALDTPIPRAERAAQAYGVGIHNIAEGIVNVAVKHGLDPRDYSLVAYGAAGPMLLPPVLDLVHVRRVIIPPHPGLFSALGLLSSDLIYADHRTSYAVLSPDAAAIDELYSSMEEGLRGRLGNVEGVSFERSFDARLLGQTWETPFIAVPGGTIDADAIATMIEEFHVVYEQRTGNRFDALPVQGVTYRVRARVPVDKVDYPALEARQDAAPEPKRTITLIDDTGTAREAAEHQREELRPGDRVTGPAVIREELSTTQVGVGQVASIGCHGEIIIEREEV